MSKAATRKPSNAIVADDYLELVRRFPLRPIRNEADYDRAVAIHGGLAARAEAGGISSGENDYLDMLVRIIRDYDEQHSSILKEMAGRKPTPIEMLRYLMEEHDMNTVSLGK